MSLPGGIDEDDELVREMDVHLCNGRLDAQLYLMQYPLRPEWRPYQTEDCEQLRFKPRARRFEMDIPLSVNSENYDEYAEDKQQVRKTTFRSSEVVMHTAYAVGVIYNDALFLTPIEGAFHLKPDMSHLDTKKVEEEDPQKSKEKGGVTQLQVRVQKRETEAQQKRRLTSYSHMAQLEQEENWRILETHLKKSHITRKLFEQITTPLDVDIPITMNKDDFLTSFAPEVEAQDLEHPRTELAEKDGKTDGAEAEEKLEDDVLEALPRALNSLFKKHGCANLKNIRQWLADFPGAGAASSAARASDSALHNAILSSHRFLCVKKRMYMQSTTGISNLDPFRSIVIEMLKNPEKEMLKKTEVQNAATEKGIQVTDAVFGKVMKSLCSSKPGGFWQLKTSCDS